MHAVSMRVLAVVVALLGGVLGWTHRCIAQTVVDLELVLAVDVSLSMDIDEQRLQRDGYVSAFRDPDIIKSIMSGPNARIAVTYVEWAGPEIQSVVMPWTIIDGEASAIEFSRRLEAVPISRARMTSISGALHYADGLFETSGVRSLRRVIDVSGDGPNNAGPPVVPVRDAIVAKGVVINGLPILLKRPASLFDIENLDQYYADCVIGGTGSFSIPVREPAEFRTATRKKLLLEIAGLVPVPQPRLVRIQAGPSEATADCLVGEKRWNLYYRGIPN